MSGSALANLAAKVGDLFQFSQDFLFITLDSLRFDTAADALAAGMTPVFKDLIGQWQRRQTSATYTLPAHVAMFSGSMPRPPRGDDRSADTEPRMFALSTSWNRYKGRNIRYFFDDAENVPKGFESKGYRTIGVGGVGWFSNQVKASAFWEGRYFQQFLYKPTYGEDNPRAFEEQIDDLAEILQQPERRRNFVFVNISSTHRPYSNGDGTLSVKAQRMCLQYVDRHLPKLLDLFPHGAVGIVCGDHGDCMGEDGLWGHNVVHEQVMTVPYAELEF
jgi:hypothetical protein